MVPVLVLLLPVQEVGLKDGAADWFFKGDVNFPADW